MIETIEKRNPRNVKMDVRFTEEERRLVKRIAKDNDLTIAELLRMGVNSLIEKRLVKVRSYGNS